MLRLLISPSLKRAIGLQPNIGKPERGGIIKEGYALASQHFFTFMRPCKLDR